MRLSGLIVMLLANAALLWFLDTNLLVDAFSISGTAFGPWGAYIVVGTAFTLVNALIRPILFLVSLPFRFLTFGLLNFALNAGLVYVSEYLVNFFAISGVTMSVNGLVYYLILGVILAAANSVLHWFV